MQCILSRPPRSFFEIDFLESDHPALDPIVLLGPHVGNMEPIKDIVVVWKFAGTDIVALACKDINNYKSVEMSG
jgi:hypothetical protein